MMINIKIKNYKNKDSTTTKQTIQTHENIYAYTHVYVKKQNIYTYIQQ